MGFDADPAFGGVSSRHALGLVPMLAVSSIALAEEAAAASSQHGMVNINYRGRRAPFDAAARR